MSEEPALREASTAGPPPQSSWPLPLGPYGAHREGGGHTPDLHGAPKVMMLLTIPRGTSLHPHHLSSPSSQEDAQGSGRS